MGLLGILKRRSGGSAKGRLDDLQARDLPSFSPAVIHLLGKLRDSDVPMKEIANDLAADPGLHVRALRTVNSAAFGLTQKVTNVHHAGTLLGRHRVESLVLSVAVRDSVQESGAPPWFDLESFWRSSARRAALARGLAEHLDPGTEAEAFTAGLLQDMGVPVLAALKGDAYRVAYEQWQAGEEEDLPALEQQHVELDHPTVGRHMALNWELPESLVQAISTHHDGGESPGIPLAVRIAALLRDRPDPEVPSALALQVQCRHGLDPELLTGLIEQALDGSSELAEALT